ncbi:MAG: hypothetical protein RL264_2652 [Bacteroidota bacterium]|jgi:threonine/homoserine/homoserine lactone efflux protein
MQFFAQAFGVGFLLSVMVGPVFFVLLETSITKGIKAALAIDFGVLLSDVVYILFASLFYYEVKALGTDSNKTLFGFIGGSVFLIYGIIQFFKKPQMKKDNSLDVNDTVNGHLDYVMLAIKGFLLNLANPLVVFYWFSVMSLANHSMHVEKLDGDMYLFLYLTTVLLTFFGIDVLKILGARKLRPLVNVKLLTALNRLIGIVFFVFGVFLILKNFVK